VPLSYLVLEGNSGLPQPAQAKVPRRFSVYSGLLKGLSVPALGGGQAGAGGGGARGQQGLGATRAAPGRRGRGRRGLGKGCSLRAHGAGRPRPRWVRRAAQGLRRSGRGRGHASPVCCLGQDHPGSQPAGALPPPAPPTAARPISTAGSAAAPVPRAPRSTPGAAAGRAAERYWPPTSRSTWYESELSSFLHSASVWETWAASRGRGAGRV
jgi:hypothetical protein